MIIVGNSHVSMFRQGGTLLKESREIVEVKWVGAITIDCFLNNHPAAQKIRRLFSQTEDWKFLSIGLHDILMLVRAHAHNQYDEAYKTLLEHYKTVFSELNSKGKLGWLIGPQLLTSDMATEKEVLASFRTVTEVLSEWCAENKIVVINPLHEILDRNGHPKPELLGVDNIHLNSEAIRYYLEEIQDKTGQKLIFIPISHPLENILEPKTGPESLSLLVAEELGLPWEKTKYPHGTRRQFEDHLIDFICVRLSQRNISILLHRDMDFVNSGLFDSMDLVEIYTYATELLGTEINFDVSLIELNTISKLSDFIYKNKPLTRNDFFETLTQENPDEIRYSETLFADARIAKMPAEMALQFKEIILTQTGGTNFVYGIIFFWMALIEAELSHYSFALELLKQAENIHLSFPFCSSRLNYYRNLWENKFMEQQRGTSSEFTDVNEDVAYQILKKTDNMVDQNIDSEITSMIDHLYQHGDNLLNQENFEDAKDAFIRTLQICPNHSLAFYKLGMLSWKQKDINLALQYFNNAFLLDTSNRDIVSSFANFCVSIGCPEQAERIYSIYFQNNPQNTPFIEESSFFLKTIQERSLTLSNNMTEKPERSLPSTHDTLDKMNKFRQWIKTLATVQKRLYYRDQTPESLYALVERVNQYHPTKIIELGTLFGLSLRTWLSIGTQADIIAIDLSFSYLYQSQQIIPIDLSRVKLMEQDILKTDFSTLWTVEDRVLFYIDAHDQPQVPLMDFVLQNALPFLPKGSVVMVDDLWYSPNILTSENIELFFEQVVTEEMDPLHPFEASYAPYWKGGSFLGFLEVVPLMKWVNQNQVTLNFKPKIKSVSFQWP